MIITGATQGIGLAAAVELARRGAQLVLVGRSQERLASAVARVRAAAPDAQPDTLRADLSLMSSVRELAGEILERYPEIHVLVNNAGGMNSRRQLTSEGLELTLATNHLAPFLLTSLLRERLVASAPARVITTASDAHIGARIHFDDLEGRHGYGFIGLGRYGETKLANILFTGELARRLEGTGVAAYCFHPGLVATGFNRNNGPLLSLAMRAFVMPLGRSPEKGAETLVWLAETDDVTGESDGYYHDRRLTPPSREAEDLDTARRLWEVSEELVAAR
ncbi:MAG TPA: SDR family oxidoreductase [Candidatus Dormibacteraeota bacterium]